MNNIVNASKSIKSVLNSLKRIALNGSPYINSFHKSKSIFIHIPKNAGISIEKAIYEEKVGHHRYMEYAIASPLQVSTYFTFSFVRNPWSRVLSAFNFLKEGGRNPADKQWAERYLDKFKCFDEFVLALQNERFREIVLSWQHFRPQIDYLINHKGNIGVDYVGRVETIKKDFKLICKKIGISARLPHLNKSPSKSYKKEYTKESKNVVKRIYERDIQLFEYKY